MNYLKYGYLIVAFLAVIGLFKQTYELGKIHQSIKTLDALTKCHEKSVDSEYKHFINFEACIMVNYDR